MDRRLSWLLVGLWTTVGALPVLAQSVDPDFRPKLVGVEFTSRQVRPGDPFAMTLKFRNEGTKAARSDYRVFVHFEAPTADCANLVINADHEPTVDTTPSITAVLACSTASRSSWIFTPAASRRS